MPLAGLLAFGAPFLFSLALTALLRRAAPHLGLLDLPAGRKAHPVPVPLGGGVAVALALMVACGFWALLPSEGEFAPLREGMALRARDMAWILGGAVVVFAVGLLDDLKDLGPGAKLSVELGVAVSVALLVPEARVSALSSAPVLQVALAVAWIVGLTNAFNFLDNMDGLSAGVAAIAAALLAAIALSTGRLLMAGYFLALLGAVAGFLAFNMPPASIFLGDAGSLLIGYLMSVGSILFTYDQAPRSMAPLGVPLLVFGVPIFDAVTVLGIRLQEGRPLSRGDRSHFSHRLVALGMSPREAVGTICLLSFVVGMGALLLYHVPREGVPLLLLQALGALAIVGLLERSARRKR